MTASEQAARGTPPAKWDANDIPSQHGKIAIVTGSDSGIGYVTARELARKGANVVLACRNEEKTNDALERMRTEIKDAAEAGTIEFMMLDLAILASVRSFAEAFRSKFNRLDLLVNNAGTIAVPFAKTVDGLESQFASNYFGHFVLTALLFDLLKKSGTSDSPSRIVSTSSLLHRLAKLNLDEIMPSEDKYWTFRVYSNTKLCINLFMLELARRLKAAGINEVITVLAHPGSTRTKLTTPPAQHPNWFLRLIWQLGAIVPYHQHVDVGALPTLYAATAPDVQSGQFFGPRNFFHQWGYPALETPGNGSDSEEAAQKLWSYSEELTKTQFKVQ